MHNEAYMHTYGDRHTYRQTEAAIQAYAELHKHTCVQTHRHAGIHTYIITY